GTTEIRQGRLRYQELPEREQREQDPHLRCKNTQSVRPRLAAGRRNLRRLRFNGTHCVHSCVQAAADSIRASAVKHSVFFLDFIHLQSKTWAIHTFAVCQLKRESVQGTSYHGLVRREFSLQHGCLHVRAAALEPAEARLSAKNNDT